MHTKGPWEARLNQFSRWEIHYGAGQLANVAKHDDPATPPSIKECEANARLIAASPTMYEYIAIRAKEGDEDAAKIIASIE